LFTVGNSKSKVRSELARANLIICGKETISFTDPDPYAAHFGSKDKLPMIIPKRTYSKWFEVMPGDESHAECGIEKYDV